MSGFSVFTAQAVINHFVRGATQPVPDGTFLALFVADPTDSNITANEVAAAWYDRQEIPTWAAPTGSGTATSNSTQIAFDPVTGSAVSVTHWGIYSAVSAGDLLYSGPFTSGGVSVTKVLNVDDVLVVQAGELELDFQ